MDGSWNSGSEKGENFGLELLEPETVDGQSGQE